MQYKMSHEISESNDLKNFIKNAPGKWYVVHSYAGFENRVKNNLENRINSLGITKEILEIRVPTEKITEIKNSQRKVINKVRVPGYILIRMHLTDISWNAVRRTPGITGFVGNGHNPTYLNNDEIFSLLNPCLKTDNVLLNKQQSSIKRKTKVDFEIGESVIIKEGAFENLPATISEIKTETETLVLLVSIFERETPMSLSFDQVKKI